MEITHKIKMDLSQQSIPPRIGVVQGDAFTRRLTIALFADKRPWKVPADASVIVRYRKPNGTSGAYDTLPDGKKAVSVSGNCVSILVAPEVLSQTGNISLMVTILSGTRQLSTFAVELAVQAMYASDQAPESTAWIAAFLPAPEESAVGQYLAVKTVDEHGRVLSLKAVDAPTGNPEEIRAAVAEYLADFDFSTGTGAISVTHEWNGTVLTVTSASGTSSADLKGETGEKGDTGAAGISPHIGSNGNWWIGDTDTGVAAGGSGSSVTVDSAFSETSENPLQNKIITQTMQAFTDMIADEILPGLLPRVSVDDNGKIPRVVNGAWAAVDADVSSVTIDPTLSNAGQAADAKAVGDLFAQAMEQVNGSFQTLVATIPTGEQINALIDTKLGVIENGTY